MTYVISDIPEIKLQDKPSAADLQAAGTVIIGLGDPNGQDIHGACILNHKGAADKTKRSVTQFIADADDVLIETWRSCLGAVGVKCIVLEDLSLDTCFALNLFLSRMDPKENSTDPLDEWVDYISDWEQGFYPDKGTNPRESVACVASCLGHSYLNANDVRAGLIACSGFLWELSEKFPKPRGIAFDKKSPHYLRAAARYDYENGQLRTAVEYGATFQLMLPVGGSNEKILTDAIALRERGDLSAILKILLRNDGELSWTKRGFGLLALHRPDERGTGNDMTISVDPDTNLSLDQLWWSLEALENEKWGEERPKGENKGRRLQSHLDRKTNPEDWPHQPWYDGRAGGERHSTLLGAPKFVLVNNEQLPGSKLDWRNDVLPALWRSYSPIPSGVKPVLTDQSGKKVAIVSWDLNARRDVMNCPTFLGWLAAQSMGIEVRSPLDIPRPSTYQVLSLPGGLALIHRDGVTLFDDETEISFNQAGFKETALQVADYLCKYHEFIQGNWLKNALGNQARLRNKGGRFNIKEFHDWQQRSADAKRALHEVMNSRFLQIESPEQSRLRESIEISWGFAGYRDGLLDMVERSDQVTHQIFSLLREKRDKWLNSILTGLGSGLLAKQIFEPFKDKFTMNMYEWQIEMFRNNADLSKLKAIADQTASWELYTIGVFVTFFVAGFVLYWRNGAKLGGAE